MTAGQREYLRNVADWLIGDDEPDEPDESTRLEERRNAIWGQMSQAERDETNELVEAIFGQWL